MPVVAAWTCGRIPAMPNDTLPPALQPIVARALARLRQAAAETWQPDWEPALARLAVASDFAVDTLVRQPALIAGFAAHGAAPLPPPPLLPGRAEDWPAQLRRWRAAGSARLVWRDVMGLDDIDATLAGATVLAEDCLRLALDALEGQFAERHGVVRDAGGHVQRLVVFGLGKLGGGELNFSSDVDLVYAYPQGGESDGARPLAAEEYFARLGQRLARLLDETTADGFCHRVDLRLRPFGSAGRLALSFAAMDVYFQQEGRDWERYAWIKARPVAGDIAAGMAWLQELRPFVYRRYLDFTALDSLRDMKAAIVADVARREQDEDIKRGRGGIREIEFLVQSLQLIRGGRDAALRQPRLLPALDALARAGQVAPGDAAALASAYRFLRHLENRLQMLRDAQTHVLPRDEDDRARLAAGLGFPAWAALHAHLEAVRERVSGEFGALLAPHGRQPVPGALDTYWRALPDGGHARTLAEAGFAQAEDADRALRDFVRSAGVHGLSDAARVRLDRVLPALLQAAAHSPQPDAALRRVLALLQAILRRASYLALLDEQPGALQRLVDVFARSAFLAERLVAHPLLLDELLDARVAGPLPDADAMASACNAALAGDDPELALRGLNETRQALSFRIGLATLDRRQPAEASAAQLAGLAEAVLRTVLAMARADMVQAHGELPGGSFAIVGYGSLGGSELGFGSDLDLVFLHDHPPGVAASDGRRPLEPGRWFARLAQKVMALLATQTGAGRLYDIDVRLRPDGGQGTLVSSLASYADYQRARAWTWEHQALVRARGVAGDAGLLRRFDAVRTEVLVRPRARDVLAADVARMRGRMRATLDRSEGARFDLKQGEGGLVDLEFVLQFLVLAGAARAPALCRPRNSAALLDALADAGLLAADRAGALHRAHAVLLDAGLHCTLDRRPRIVAVDAAITAAREAVRAAWQAAGLPAAVAGAD